MAVGSAEGGNLVTLASTEATTVGVEVEVLAVAPEVLVCTPEVLGCVFEVLTVGSGGLPFEGAAACGADERKRADLGLEGP